MLSVRINKFLFKYKKQDVDNMPKTFIYAWAYFKLLISQTDSVIYLLLISLKVHIYQFKASENYPKYILSC